MTPAEDVAPMMAVRSYGPIERVAVLGTGLMGTSVAMATMRVEPCFNPALSSA